MDGVVHATACLSVLRADGAVFVSRSAPSADGDLHRDQERILQSDLLPVHDMVTVNITFIT